MAKPSSGTLFLIPSGLSADRQHSITTPQVCEVLKQVRHLFVENIRSARRFIASLQLGVDIGSFEFFEYHKKIAFEALRPALDQLMGGTDFGLMSEAGLPAVADPGAQLVSWAHRHGICVRPLSGSSSIFLALMASGLNGQSFCFHGYLPIDKQERLRKLKQLEQAAQRQVTQIFIETPYRNQQLLESILQHVSTSLHLCIAANLTSAEEWVFTQPVGLWQKSPPNLHKQPSVFLLGKQV